MVWRILGEVDRFDENIFEKGSRKSVVVTLHTLVVEIEAILNDRPLTYISSDVRDEEPLTPSHLLYSRRITSFPNESLDEDEFS